MKDILKITASKGHGMDIEMHGTISEIMAALTIACDGVMRELTDTAKCKKQLKRDFIKALKATDTSEFEIEVADNE